MKHTSRPGLPPSTRFGSTLSAPWHVKDTSPLTGPLGDARNLASVGSSSTKQLNQLKKSIRVGSHQELDRDWMSDTVSLLSTDDSATIKMTDLKSSQLDAIRYELLRKTEQAEMISDVTQLAQARMKTLDQKVIKLRAAFAEKDKACASSQRSVDKLIAINMMLIDTLDALGLQPSSDKGLSKLMIRLRSDLLPSIRAEIGGNPLTKICNDDIHSVNAKLKEGLLIMSREYYWSKKSMKTTFGVYEELRCALRVVDQKNRTLQHDLDEIRKDDESNITKQKSPSSTPLTSCMTTEGDRGTGEEIGTGMGIGIEGLAGKGCDEGEKAGQLQFNRTLKSLVERHSIDAVDAIQLMRRFFSIVSACPSTLDVSAVAAHTVSRELCDTFDVAMICLYLDIPERPGYMTRYIPRSLRPEVIDVTPPCLVGGVVKLGRPVRLNNLEEFAYDPLIDGITGIKILRVFSMPLRDTMTCKVFGALHFMNKHENDIFTNGDELFMKVFGCQLEAVLSCCRMHERVNSKAELMDHLLRASVDLGSTIPCKGTLVAHRPVLIGEILHALETITKDAFKCIRVRSFIVTSPFVGRKRGSLLFLKTSTCRGLTRYSSTLDLVEVVVSAGLAGKAAQTMDWNQMHHSPPEGLNLDADLDPGDAQMITFPICLTGGHLELGYENQAVAVLQMVLGPLSPRMATPNSDNETSLVAAVLWLTSLISPPLLSLLHRVALSPLRLVEPVFARPLEEAPAPILPPAPLNRSLSQHRRGSSGDERGLEASSSSLTFPYQFPYPSRPTSPLTPSRPSSPYPFFDPSTSTCSSSACATPSRIPTPVTFPSRRDPHYVDPEEHERFKRHIVALQRANKKLLQPAPAAPKVFSAKAIFDSANIEKRVFRAAAPTVKKDDKFAQFQADQAIQQVVAVREQLRRAVDAQEAAEKSCKEKLWAVAAIRQDVDDSEESLKALALKKKSKQEELELILELVDTLQDGKDFLALARDEALLYGILSAAGSKPLPEQKNTALELLEKKNCTVDKIARLTGVPPSPFPPSTSAAYPSTSSVSALSPFPSSSSSSPFSSSKDNFPLGTPTPSETLFEELDLKDSLITDLISDLAAHTQGLWDSRRAERRVQGLIDEEMVKAAEFSALIKQTKKELSSIRGDEKHRSVRAQSRDRPRTSHSTPAAAVSGSSPLVPAPTSGPLVVSVTPYRPSV